MSIIGTEICQFRLGLNFQCPIFIFIFIFLNTRLHGNPNGLPLSLDSQKKKKKKKKLSSLDSQKIYKLAYKTMQSYKFKYN
jgi:hypothetical protein